MTEFVIADHVINPDRRDRWEDRLREMERECPNQWVDVCATYGLSPRGGGHIQRAVRKLSETLGIDAEAVTCNQGKPDHTCWCE